MTSIENIHNHCSKNISVASVRFRIGHNRKLYNLLIYLAGGAFDSFSSTRFFFLLSITNLILITPGRGAVLFIKKCNTLTGGPAR